MLSHEKFKILKFPPLQKQANFLYTNFMTDHNFPGNNCFPAFGNQDPAEGPAAVVRVLLPQPGRGRRAARQGAPRVPGAALRVRTHAGTAKGAAQAGDGKHAQIAISGRSGGKFHN